MTPRIYLDHAATTPMLPEARAAVAEGMARWANPSSPHAEGRAARAALEGARERIKAALGWNGALIFTSGASEAAAFAFRQATVGAHVVSAVEHDAVRRAAPAAAVIPVDGTGLVDLAALTGPALIAIQSVNSETGIVQPADQVAAAIRAGDALWLADCSQSAGKLPLPLADLIILSAHKLGGPPGIGALLVRDLALLRPAGGQEQGYRGGTENLPGALGFAAALEARGSRDHLIALRATLDTEAVALGAEIVGADSPRLAEIGSYRLPGVSAVAQLIALDAAGIAVSAGSACSSGSMRPSPVLAAMRWSEREAGEVIRVSFGLDTSDTDIARFLDAWRPLAARRRAA